MKKEVTKMMLSQINRDRKFQFADHPWIYQLVSVLTLILLFIPIVILANLIGIPNQAPYRSLIIAGLPQALAVFVLAPFVFHVPAGKQSYSEYLREIRLTQLKPFLPLLIP